MLSSFRLTDIMMLATGTSPTREDVIFGLDSQLLFDSIILACAVFALFFLLSYLVFNPARDLMKKRQEKIQKDINDAEQEKQDAIAFKKEYDDRLKAVDKEIDLLLSEGKKKALKREQAIVDEANQEAARIMERTSREVELEKSKVKDEVKTEMILVATEMASHFIKNEMTEQKQAAIVDEVLREMGDSTWQD